MSNFNGPEFYIHKALQEAGAKVSSIRRCSVCQTTRADDKRCSKHPAAAIDIVRKMTDADHVATPGCAPGAVFLLGKE